MCVCVHLWALCCGDIFGSQLLFTSLREWIDVLCVRDDGFKNNRQSGRGQEDAHTHMQSCTKYDSTVLEGPRGCVAQHLQMS